MDIRNPIGLLFPLLGLLLTGAGLFGDAAAKTAKNLPAGEAVNINLGWGLVLLVFGIGMLTLAFLSRKKV